MREHLTQISRRQAAAALALVALSAVAVVFIGRAVGLGGFAVAVPDEVREEQAAPRQQSQDGAAALTLTLTAPEVCETVDPIGFAGYEQVPDGAGGFRTQVQLTGFERDSITWMDVAWSVIGGAEPVEVTIEGATYSGRDGVAEVSCAQSHGPLIDDPVVGLMWEDAPVVDSGWKTIRGTVADSAGASADAQTRTYIIWDRSNAWTKWPADHPLRGGETYRVFGHLITIPETVDMYYAGGEEASCSGSSSHCGPWTAFGIVGTEALLWVLDRDWTVNERDTRDSPTDEGATGSATSNMRIEDAFTDFIESIDRMPDLWSE